VAAYARFTIEVEDADIDENDELDELVEEIREELYDMIDRYLQRGFKIKLVD
jgi:hypothetical protein